MRRIKWAIRLHLCVHSGIRRVGRPSIVVDEEQITHLRSLHFSWGKIGRLLRISESTQCRRRGGLTEGNVSKWTDSTGSYNQNMLMLLIFDHAYISFPMGY